MLHLDEEGQEEEREEGAGGGGHASRSMRHATCVTLPPGPLGSRSGAEAGGGGGRRGGAGGRRAGAGAGGRGGARGAGMAEGAPEWQTLMHEGYLMKKSPSLFGGWQKRYVRLYNNGIAYYNANASSAGEESGLLGFLHIDGIENVETTPESFRVTAFCQKRGPGRDYEFKTEAGEDIKEWVDKMQDLVNSKPSS